MGHQEDGFHSWTLSDLSYATIKLQDIGKLNLNFLIYTMSTQESTSRA